MDFKKLIGKFTIYQYMSFFLVILVLASALVPSYGFGAKSLFPVVIAVITAVLLDMIFEYFKSKTIEFPYSALISGLLIGGLLTQGLKWHVYAIASVIAILSKHLIKVHHRHIFNPANFGVLLVFLIFGAHNSWWLASPVALATVFGIFLVWRLRRIDLALSFLIAYFFIESAIKINNGAGFSEIISFVENSGIILFFAMFMLTEPKTNPAGKKQRMIYGILVAIMYIPIEMQRPDYGVVFMLAVANLFVPALNRLRLNFWKKETPNNLKS